MLELGVRPNDTLADPPSVELRHLEPDDWLAVAEIYWDGMRDGLATFETEVPSWEAWNAAHLRSHRLVTLLQELIVGAEATGIWTIQTSIFPENRASLALHERCGFRVVGTRERVAKRDGIWRDTVFLERRSEVVT